MQIMNMETNWTPRFALATLAVVLTACQSTPGSAPQAARTGGPVAVANAPAASAPVSGGVVPSLQPPLQGASQPAVQPSSQPPQPARALQAPRIGLALGGGAARGFAHIGALQVLEEAGIRPAVVVGTSAGSLVAALYASGKSAQDLAALALTMDEGAITDWAFPSRGVIRGEALARYVREQTGGRSIEQLPMALGIVATDLDSGAPVLFQRGDVGTAVRASSAVPAVFQPVKIGEREYVDGGLVSPVPVRYTRQMGAQMVIAIDISTPPDGNPTGDSFKLLMQTVAIMMRSINRLELEGADLVLRPVLTGVAGSDFNSRVRALRAGREAATAMLPEIRAKMAALSR